MTTRWVLALLSLLASAPFAHSKGPVDLILISGGGLNNPIEITESESLNVFNPWIGQFADWKTKPRVDAPCYRRSFEVLFYMKWPERRSSALDRGDLKMIYATRYCWTGEAGYVYLPGPGEPLYGPNGGTIIRGDADGKWHPAMPAWDSLLSSAVTMRDQEATLDKIVISGGELNHPVEITDSELLSKFDPWTGVFVDWKTPARMAPATGNTKLLISNEAPVSKKGPNRKRPPIRQASD